MPVVFGRPMTPEVAKGRPEQPGEDEDLFPGRRLAGIDVDQRVARTIRGLDGGRPGMELDRGLLGEPGEGRDPVDDDVLLDSLAVAQFAAADPRGRMGRKVLLPEALALDSVRKALERQAVVVGGAE